MSGVSVGEVRSAAGGWARPLLWAAIAAAIVGLGYLVISARGGVPDPTAAQAGSLSHSTVVFDSAILVLREGLEAILVLAAVVAGLRGANEAMRKPVGIGAGVSLLAIVALWFAAIWLLGELGGAGLDLQAATGLVAVVVLMVVMNWFLHRVYWTGWMNSHHKRRRRLLDPDGGSSRRSVLLGFGLLGFTAVFREGFEVVLFLQNLRLKAGSEVVLQGVAIGMAATFVVGVLTFWLNARLPYKKMLIATGILIGFVLVVMVGEGVQEMQLAGWIPTTTVDLAIPGWMGTWFALFPTIETLVAQVLAAAFVIGSYFLAEYMKLHRPRQRGERPARRAALPPQSASPLA